MFGEYMAIHLVKRSRIFYIASKRIDSRWSLVCLQCFFSRLSSFSAASVALFLHSGYFLGRRSAPLLAAALRQRCAERLDNRDAM